MKRVGLTGGIGSGKSTVLKIFKSLAIPTYIADEKAKELLNTDAVLKEKLKDTFGDIYSNGEINRQLFASIIFTDDSKRVLANEIIHPFVKEDFQQWSLNQEAAYVIQEAAILFETASYKLFDKTILITAPEELRIKRIQDRDGMSIDQVQERINAQWTDKKKSTLADYIITNDDNASLIEQVLAIHSSLIGE